MKPGRFAYRRATSVDEALAVLAEHGDEAKVLAGGQSLVPLLNMRLAQPQVLVDISKVEALTAASVDDGEVRYGAATVHRRFEDGDVADATGGLLRTAAAGIGYRAIRNRGTVGGSLAHADASAEWPVVMAATDARVLVRSATAERTVPAREFVTGFFSSALDDDELITEVCVPRLTADTTWGLHKFVRKLGEFSESLGVAILRWDGGTVAAADIWLGAARDVPVRVTPLEERLVGAARPVDAAEAETALAGVLPAPSNAEARYRRHLHAVTLSRAVADAITRRTA
ncbi:MAG TPA: FAD binding domain-containing protein [Mycobacteriales bacterium]|nr:FAD binding domain-containing protein [Mycobacteriales bacterium]